MSDAGHGRTYSSSHDAEDLWARFTDPGPEFSPVPIWFWSGDRLDERRLRWQLERLAEGGVFNVIPMNLAPAGPLFGSDSDEPLFLSERWWQIFSAVCDDAAALGVRIWFYDQIGFSGANLQGQLISSHPEFVGWSLERSVIDGQGRLLLSAPPDAHPLAAAVVALDAQGQPSGPCIGIPISSGRVEWESPAPHRLVLFYAETSGFDYFSPVACASLIDMVHGEFDRRLKHLFGSVIVGSFQDELPAMPTWSSNFAEQFQRRYGYELLSNLPALFDDLGVPDDRVRSDLHSLRAALAEEAFFAPLHKWHEERQLLCGFDQQTGAREGQPVASTEIYGDYLRTHRWYSAPGSDHHGEAKIHSSLAHHYGRPRVWIESFHSAGWGATLEDTFDWLLPWIGAGANLYDPHATYYSTRAGWWEWAPPTWDWRQPYWPHHRYFARAVARLCAMLTAGEHVCDIGVLYPSATARAGSGAANATPRAQRADAVYRAVVGEMAWWHPIPGVLTRLARDFDVLDDDTVARAKVCAGQLETEHERYRVVVMPACSVLEQPTAERLGEFVESGGLLVAVGTKPERIFGAADESVRAELLEKLRGERVRLVEDPEHLGALLEDVRPLIEAPVPTLVRQSGDWTVAFVPATASRATVFGLSSVNDERDLDAIQHAWRYKLDYRFERERYAASIDIVTHDVAGTPELWEPFSGERRKLETRLVDGAVHVCVPFHDGPAALVVWNGGAPGEPNDAYRELPPSSEVVLDDTWDIELEPCIEDPWGDLALPSSGSDTWEILHRVGDGPWAAVHASFGPRAVWQGPAPERELPLPEQRVMGWKDVVWSDSRGIYRDHTHIENLGPKGRVPEEFLDFGPVSSGESVHLRATVSSAVHLATSLAIGACAIKRAWLGGREVALEGNGYLAMGAVTLEPGLTQLDVRLTASEDVAALRGHFAFVRDRAGYERPEWLEAPTADDEGTARFSTTLELSAASSAASLLIGSFGACRVLVDGEEVGRQGGFGPRYEARSERLQWHDLHAVLGAGRHELALEVPLRCGTHGAVLVDGLVVTENERLAVRTGPGWRAERNGAPMALVYHLEQVRGDPAYAHAYRRPHPLPGAGWLEGDRSCADAGGNVAIMPPRPARSQQFRFVVPPGARSMQVPLVPGCDGALRVGQVELRLPADGSSIELPDEPIMRECTVSVMPSMAVEGGALLRGPIHFEIGTGRMELVDWESAGLCSFSGALRYRKRTQFADADADRVELDLGDVRGSAEVLVDGTSAGIRVCAPYVFDLTGRLSAAGSTLEVLVLGTLASHLNAVSPTTYVQRGQTRTGIFGPVKLRGWRAGR